MNPLRPSCFSNSSLWPLWLIIVLLRCYHRPYFNRSGSRRRDARRNPVGLIRITCFNHKESTHLLARFGEWAVSDQLLAIAHADALRRRRGLQLIAEEILTARLKLFDELPVLCIDFLELVFGTTVKCLFVMINQQNVFHRLSPIGSEPPAVGGG